MKPGFWDYARAAFNARPWGMFVPPNWVGLGAFALLGTLNPGFWVLGLGLELGYLWVLTTNPRFQRTIIASREGEVRKQWQARVNQFVTQLSPEARRRYAALEQRSRSILEQHQGAGLSAGVKAHAEGLGRLLWIYLRLLLARQRIRKILQESEENEEGLRMEQRIRKLEDQLEDPALSDELRRSLTGQIEILRQRLEKRGEAAQKLAFLDAELTRIEEQVELIREQAAISADPEVLSRRIDEITSTLGGTTQWIREQQQLYGALEDLLAEPPPIASGALKESQ